MIKRSEGMHKYKIEDLLKKIMKPSDQSKVHEHVYKICKFLMACEEQSNLYAKEWLIKHVLNKVKCVDASAV